MSDSPTPHWRLLEPLRPTERAAVLAATTRRRFGRGDTIFFEGDPGESVHLLATGRVAIRAATPGGDTVTYAIAGPGDAFVTRTAYKTLTGARLPPAASREKLKL